MLLELLLLLLLIFINHSKAQPGLASVSLATSGPFPYFTLFQTAFKSHSGHDVQMDGHPTQQRQLVSMSRLAATLTGSFHRQWEQLFVHSPSDVLCPSLVHSFLGQGKLGQNVHSDISGKEIRRMVM